MIPRSVVGAVATAALAALAACDGESAKPAPPKDPAGKPRAAPAEAPKTVPSTIRFEECAEASGLRFRMNFLPDEQGEHFKINFYDHGCGVAIGDYDQDGLDDVFLCNQLGPCSLFRSVGGGKFVETTRDAGELAKALDGKICVAASWADPDGDGALDLFVTTTRGGNVFLKNTGGGVFRETTKDAGLTLVAESETPCFFDIDGDGDLDLFLTNTAKWTLDRFDEVQRYYPGVLTLDELVRCEKLWNVLYVNDGTGHFTDVTAERGMKGKGWGGDVAAFDADGDGDLDLFVGNMFGLSTLYRNDGKGHFADVTQEVLGRASWGAVGARAFDYDGDAEIDLFVADMHSDMWTPTNLHPMFVEEKRKYPTFLSRAVELGSVDPRADEDFAKLLAIRPSDVFFGNTLFRNKGDGKFEETSERAGTETFWPWGVADGDYDQDGAVDVFIPSGMGSPFFFWRSPLLRNRGDGTFEDVSKSAGFDPPPGGRETAERVGGKPFVRSSRSAATADFDADGRLDLVVSNFNDRVSYFRNVTPARHWCELRLTGGSKGNRDAIGAVARVTAGGKTQIRQVQACGGYLSQSSNTLHFGLADATSIDRVEIRWPSGAMQVVPTPKIDTLLAIKEPAR